MKWRTMLWVLICLNGVSAQADYREAASETGGALRVSTDEACALLQLKRKALLHIQATRIHCEAACPQADTLIPVPVQKVMDGGMLVKTALVKSEMEKQLKGTDEKSPPALEMNNVLISVSICEDKNGKCGKEVAQLLRLRGNYLEALESTGKLPIELWVDAKRVSQATQAQCAMGN